MIATTPTVEPLNWRRIGALSTSFNVHGLALALALLAMTAPDSRDAIGTPPDPTLVAVISEPVPPAPPTPPRRERSPVQPLVQPVRARAIRAAPEAPTAVDPSAADATPVAAAVAPTTTALTRPVETDRAAVAFDHVQPPAYPVVARRQRLEGETLVRILVGRDGRPAQVRIERSSGHAVLDRSALQAVRGWRFHPARVDGRPHEAWIVVPVGFRLERG